MITEKEKEFIKFVKAECKKHKVKCDLRKTKYVKLSGSIKCSGWFDSEKRELVCSMNRPDSIEILVHEYCHLTQWVDKFPLWDVSTDSMGVIDRWLDGDVVVDIDKHIANARDLELDNEKRSVELMLKWGLNVDTNQYTKKANAYVLFYNHMLKTRKWSKPENSPYKNQNVLDMMSDKFDMNYDVMDSEIQKVFVNENI